MAKSPFRNFDPDGLSAYAAIDKPIAGSHAVPDLIRRAAITCCDNPRISNDVISRISKHVPLYNAPSKPRRITFTDFYSEYPAYLSFDGVDKAQFDAARALLLLDETLDMVAESGWTADVADRLLLANAWISDANEKFADDEKWRAIIDGEHEAAARLEAEKQKAEARIEEIEASREAHAFFRVQERTPAIVKAALNANTKKARAAKARRSAGRNSRALTIYRSVASWGNGDAAAQTISEKLGIPIGTVRNMITKWRKVGEIS